MSTPTPNAIVRAQRSFLRVRLSTIAIIWETLSQRVVSLSIATVNRETSS